MTTHLAGKTALVTGSTSGLGRAIARALAAAGAEVIVSGRDPARGAATVAEIEQAGGRAAFVPADLAAGADAARRLGDEATSALRGHVDILVNNAAIFPPATTLTADEATFDAVYTVNVKAPFFLTGALAPSMVARGSGAIVNVGSWVATRGIPSSVYSSSKAALELLTKSWASEFGRAGVRVNAVSPGVVATDGTAAHRELQDGVAGATPAGRIGSPEEVAAAVVFLASEEAAFVHGAILAVDGGKLAV